jgi:penicillin-binding protein 1C
MDPLSVALALSQHARYVKFVSGGSSITQQLVRAGRNAPRTFPNKLIEAAQAVLLELVTSKRTILTHYLNRAPYGNQCYGVGAASELYFNRPPSRLSLAQAALLAGLPQSPTRFYPYLHFARALQRQLWVLGQMLNDGFISKEAYAQAIAEPLTFVPKEQLFHAPHFCDWVLAQLPPGGGLREIRTTLDLRLQTDLEALVATTVKRLKSEQVSNASVVVLDNRTRDVLAMVGSADYFNRDNDGQVNGALAPRPPGSTWKPFTYGLALERGLPASTVLPDLALHAATENGDFSPRNYDESYHGPVRMRTALACSYNIPAVRVLERIGPEALLNRLRQAGFAFLTKPAEFYGLGLTLGGAEASLLQLTQAYAALADRGSFQPARCLLNAALPPPATIFSPDVAYLLTDILSDNDARAAAFGTNSSLRLPFQCAVKTGTSKNYRDSLTIGYTTDYTVGVWVGNFDGKPMKRVAGSTGAALFFRDVMFRLYPRDYPQSFTPPQSLVSARVCPNSGLLPSPSCPATIQELFLDGTVPTRVCDVHRSLRIDRRNGLLASEDCGDENVRTDLFEVYDPMYRLWMAEHRIPEAPTRVSPLCRPAPSALPAADAASDSPVVDVAAFAISFPNNGDVFVIDPVLRREYQTLLLKSQVGRGVEWIEWLVDGKVFQKVTAPFSARWPLSEGSHRFKIRTKIGERVTESRPITVKVL